MIRFKNAFWLLLALVAFSCASRGAVVEPVAFEPRLGSIKAEARIVFAHTANDNLDGLVPYLVHSEPMVRALAHSSIL